MDFKELSKQEAAYQKNTINFIASENYTSPAVLEEMGSVWSLKYGEGYPAKRYYAGNELTDKLESEVMKLSLEVFAPSGGYGVNLQALSGSVANNLVYLSILELGDTILSLGLNQGGHLSHLHATSNWNKFFKNVNYSVKLTNENTYEVDLENYEEMLKLHKPRLTIIGFSSYTRKIDFHKLCTIAHKYNSLVLADLSHINGLVAAGFHSSPFETKTGDFTDTADIITMTTHKTLRGPRNAVIFARNTIPENLKSTISINLIETINKSIFPGTLGGPHFNKISALGVSLQEILGQAQYPDKIPFNQYIKAVIDNCKIFENALVANGIEVISPTQTHLCLIKLPENIDSLVFQKQLEEIGIITNRNAIPFDTKSPYRPSGVRFGTAALTSRGIKSAELEELAKIIADSLFQKDTVSNLISRVKAVVETLNFYY